MKRRISIWPCILIAFFGCRDLSLNNGGGTIDGYMIEGTILDGLHQPIDSIDIVLYYGVEFVSSSPVPERSYTIENPGDFVTINVYDSEERVVRNLYSGTPSGSTLYVPWNKRHNNGSLVKSGVYTVRYLVGGSPRHSYVAVVDGHITGRTDVDGIFTIGNENLPVGYFPAPLYSQSDAFLGNYRIQNWVYLEFTIAGTLYTYSIALEQDAITHVLIKAN